jgi:hypothetical protein
MWQREHRKKLDNNGTDSGIKYTPRGHTYVDRVNETDDTVTAYVYETTATTVALIDVVDNLTPDGVVELETSLSATQHLDVDE